MQCFWNSILNVKQAPKFTKLRLADIGCNHHHQKKSVAVIKNRKKEIENFSFTFSFLYFSGFTQNKSSSVPNFMYTFFKR